MKSSKHVETCFVRANNDFDDRLTAFWMKNNCWTKIPKNGHCDTGVFKPWIAVQSLWLDKVTQMHFHTTSKEIFDSKKILNQNNMWGKLFVKVELKKKWN